MDLVANDANWVARYVEVRFVFVEVGPLPNAEPPVVNSAANNVTLDELELLPTIPWDEGLRAAWTPGEDAGRERLAGFKVPKAFHVVLELPLGPTGKVDRTALIGETGVGDGSGDSGPSPEDTLS